MRSPRVASFYAQAVAVGILSVVPYLTTLRAGFTYDDKVAVQGNPDVVRPVVSWGDLLNHDFWGNDMSGSREQGGWTHYSWRPLVTLTFRADFLRAGRTLDAAVFHASNLAIHCAACIAVLLATRTIFGSRYAGRAFLAAVIYALHPIHSECVANVTSRSDALAAVFQALALALHASGPGVGLECSYSTTVAVPAADDKRGGRRRPLPLLTRLGLVPSPSGAIRFVCVVLLLLAALLCKETALVLPALLVALDLLNSLGRSFMRHRASSDASNLAVLARSFLSDLASSGAAARSIIYLLTAAGAYHARVRVMARGYDLTGFANEIHNPFKELADPTARALSVPYVQAFALAQLLLPVTLQHEHQAMPLVYSLRDPRNLFTIAVFGVYTGVGCAALWLLVQAVSTGGGGGHASAVKGAEGMPKPSGAQEGPRANGNVAQAPAVAANGSARPDTADGSASSAIPCAVRLLYALAFIGVTYAPSSHLLVFVAFTVAERTLLLPSLGACVILAEGFVAAHEWAQGRTSAPGKPLLSLPRWASRLACGTLCVYYACRTHVRCGDWLDEGALLASSLRAYPVNNSMSLYGLGALALYDATSHASEWPADRTAARLLQAEGWLSAAGDATSLAEPHILLSQLYWRHGYRGDAGAGMARAEAELARLDNTSTPRKEVLTNLGLLMYARQASLAPWQVGRSEYLVLAAHLAHGFPPSHPSIAVLANNAGCIRLLSHTGRYGHAAMSAQAFAEAIRIQEELAGFRGAAGGSGERSGADAAGDSEGSLAPLHQLPPLALPSGGVVTLPAVYRNAALLCAVCGDLACAQSLLQRGLDVVGRGIDMLTSGVLASAPPGTPRDAPLVAGNANIQHLREALGDLTSLRLVLQVHAHTVASWGARGRGVGASVGTEPELQDAAGDDDPSRPSAPIGSTLVERRLAVLGGLLCTMELLWW